MKFFVRIDETYIGVKIDRSGIEFKDLSEIKAQIDADFAAKDAIISEFETEVETLERETKVFQEIINASSAEQTGKEKSLSHKFDRDIAQAYMNKAVRDGRAENDGFHDYIETLGVRRFETRDAHLNKIHEWDCELSKRLKRNRDKFRMTSGAA